MIPFLQGMKPYPRNTRPRWPNNQRPKAEWTFDPNAQKPEPPLQKMTDDDYLEMKNPEAYAKMVFKLRKDITAAQLEDEFFDVNGNLATRGWSMGWAHQINLATRVVSFVDPDYARKYEEKIGGLKVFIKDLIQKGWVKKQDA